MHAVVGRAVSSRARLLSQDVLAGLFFCGVALVGLWVAQDYPVGTAMRIDTGVFPRLLCWALLLLGGAILVRGLRSGSGPIAMPAWRPFIFVLLSVVFFGLFVEEVGIVLGVVGLMGIAALGSPERKLVEVGLFTGLMAVVAVAVFIWGLGLPIPVWPG